MKFSYNLLNTYFEEDLPSPDELAEKIIMHFFEVEGIEEKGDDYVLEIDILPNRAPDCFSHEGVAREIAAILDIDFKEKESDISGELDLKDLFEINIAEKDLCNRYLIGGIKNLKMKETPSFIKETLESCGLQSINIVVDIMNYVMLETGQPLHAFDGKKIEGKKINVRKAKGEKIKTLDEEDIELDDDLIIADKEPLAIAGVKGGKKAEVDKKTELVIVEAANFDRKTIRSTSKRLKLRTDASVRFEHGIDKEKPLAAMRRSLFLLEKYTGGEATKGLLDFYPQKRKSIVLKVSTDYISDVLGKDISEKSTRSILKRLGFKIEGDQEFKIRVPTWRMDIEMPEDIVEEVGRIYGYDNINPVMPKSTIVSPKENKSLLNEERFREALKTLGYIESYNYSFINEEARELFGFENLIEMENPVSLEYKYLRPSLIPNIVKNVLKNGERRLRIFELGRVFEKSDYKERKSLIGARTETDFIEMKGDLQAILEESCRKKPSFEPIDENKKGTFDITESAELKLGDEKVGIIGKIDQRILRGFNAERNIYIFEIDLEKLADITSFEKEYTPISKFPVAVRDISVLVPKEVKFQSVVNLIEQAGGELLTDTDLFDLYEGENIPEEKKNFGFRLYFQANDRTLSSNEINQLLKKIILALEERPEWEVRKQ